MSTRAVTLITEPSGYSPAALRMYRSLGPVYFWPELKGQKRERVLKEVRILAVGISIMIDRAFMERMPNLEIIASPATGLNHLDVAQARARGIRLITLRGRTSFLKRIPSTAEETIGLMLALIRNFPWAFDDVKRGRWDRMRWRGCQMAGKTLGLVGFGRLGKIVARIAKSFGMSVIAADPFVSKNAMRRRGVEQVSLKTLFRKSDIVSLHVLLTDRTQNMIGERELKLMRQSAYLINTARAELIRNGALAKALRRGWLKGAALDVLWDERGDGSHLRKDPLWRYARTHENLIIVPHVGGATYEAMAVTQEFIAALTRKWLEKR